ncbi:TPA: hypothetical protein TY416_001912 [Streptococcus suis]|nr:hypothetical protein [Streptococcus suis]
MTLSYNKINIQYEASFNKLSHVQFPTKEALYSSVSEFSDLIDFIKNDVGNIGNISPSLIFNLWYNDMNLQEIRESLNESNQYYTLINYLIIQLQTTKTQTILNNISDNISEFRNSMDKLDRHQIVISLKGSCFDDPLCDHERHIFKVQDIIEFKQSYLKDYTLKSKKIGDFIKQEFPNDIERFDFKDSDEHSKFPHLHFKKGKPNYGITLFLIDKHFPDIELFKHEDTTKESKLSQQILKILDRQGFKTKINEENN